MEIIPSLLEKYCEKNGSPIHISFDIECRELTFAFVLGKYEQNGSIKVFLEAQELNAILRANKIIGEDGKIEKIMKSKARDVDKKIAELIYDTLSKYILQMLFAARAEILFPEIIPLQKHKEVFFKNRFQYN